MNEHPHATANRSNMPRPAPAPLRPAPRRGRTSSDDEAVKWLEDAGPMSRRVLDMLGVPPVEPPTPDSDFQRDLQAAIDAGEVLELHDHIELAAPVAVHIRSSNQGWFGLDGRCHRISTRRVMVDQPALRLYMDDSTPAGTCARGLMVRDFSMLGGGIGGGLQLDVPFNDRWLVNVELRSLWFEGIAGMAACTIAGSIFESFAYNVGSQDCLGAGLRFANAGEPDNKGIASAWRLFGGTHRQDGDAGVLIDAYDGPADIRMFGLYFCANGNGGISSMAGLELVDGCGFENNEGQGVYFSNFANLTRCTGSTGGTQPYLVRGYLANPVTLRSCSMTGYGDGPPPRLGTFSGDGRLLLDDSGDGSDVDLEGDGVTLEVVP